ncbi:MAG: hypothetical protein DMF98_25145 [Acidobacteria bacterium]|nr:MAG: hypothetical protein DMF98_25145 [Acidobacteriota bacterium]
MVRLLFPVERVLFSMSLEVMDSKEMIERAAPFRPSYSITKVQHGRPLVHAPEVRQPPLFELFLLGMRTAMTLFVVVLTTLGGKLV